MYELINKRFIYSRPAYLNRAWADKWHTSGVEHSTNQQNPL